MKNSRIPWVQTAYSLIGTREAPGKENNEEIMTWARVAQLEKTYTADSIPWCGLFQAFILVDNGIVPVKDPLWALNWRNYGVAVPTLTFGGIAVFTRPGGGHVGILVGHEKNYYHILGGNQSDMVNVSRIAKNRLVAMRWPRGFEKFIGEPLPNRVLNAPITTNER